MLFGPGSPAQRLAVGAPEAASWGDPDDDCVVLATVALGGDGQAVDQWTYRMQLYSVSVLQELLFRLARRLSRLEELAGV